MKIAKLALIIIAVFAVTLCTSIASDADSIETSAEEMPVATNWNIRSADDLKSLGEAINNSSTIFAGLTVYNANIHILNDIILDSNWETLGDNNHILMGEINGNGHTIHMSHSPGLISIGAYIHIHDLRILADEVTSSPLAREIHGSSTCPSTIENIIVDGVLNYGGGMIECARPLDKPTGSVSNRTDVEITIRNCVNNADIHSEDNTRGVGILGGIYGANVKIEGCRNNGDITLATSKEAHAAGIVGYIMRDNRNNNSVIELYVTVKDCYNYGNITSKSTSDGRENVGGIVSTMHQASSFTIKNCTNYGIIIGDNTESTTNQACTGGIIGRLNVPTGEMSGCFNYGVIKAFGNPNGGGAFAGGLIGYVNNTTNTSLKNCSSMGSVAAEGNSKSFSGQMIGHLDCDNITTSYVSVPSNSKPIGYINGDFDSSSVIEIPISSPNSITLNTNSLKLNPGDTYQLEFSINPDDSVIGSYSWKSSDDSIVSVNSGGYITVKKNGNAVITIETENGLKAMCNIFTAKDQDESQTPPWVNEDEEEYFPPIVIPSQPVEEKEDDSVTIVACAAAAAVAALMAVYLMVDRKR